jgi:hypothetical protein
MPAETLKLTGGITTLVANSTGEYVVLGIEKATDPTEGMIAMLDRGQQQLLMLYLQERLKR